MKGTPPYPRFINLVLSGTASDQTFYVNAPSDMLRANQCIISVSHFACNRSTTGAYNVEMPGLQQPQSFNASTKNQSAILFTSVSNELHENTSSDSLGIQVTNPAMLLQNQLQVRCTDVSGVLLTGTIAYTLMLTIHQLPLSKPNLLTEFVPESHSFKP